MSEHIADETLKNVVVTGYFVIAHVTAKVEITFMTHDIPVDTVTLSNRNNASCHPELSVDELQRLAIDIRSWRDTVIRTKPTFEGEESPHE